MTGGAANYILKKLLRLASDAYEFVRFIEYLRLYEFYAASRSPPHSYSRLFLKSDSASANKDGGIAGVASRCSPRGGCLCRSVCSAPQKSHEARCVSTLRCNIGERRERLKAITVFVEGQVNFLLKELKGIFIFTNLLTEKAECLTRKRCLALISRKGKRLRVVFRLRFGTPLRSVASIQAAAIREGGVG